MVATLLDAGQFDPTGDQWWYHSRLWIERAYGAGRNGWWSRPMKVTVPFNPAARHHRHVTNIDPEHMEHWGDFDTLRQGFVDFVSNIPFYRLAVCCQPITPRCRRWSARSPTGGSSHTVLTPQADVRALNLTTQCGVAHFDVQFQAEDVTIDRVPSAHDPGDHNVSNALAAIAVARHLGMNFDQIRDALAAFKRRQPSLYHR